MSTPTNDIDESAPRIRSKRELVERIASGAKPKTKWRIGTEHEKFGFSIADNRPLPYRSETGGPDILTLLSETARRFGWSAILEGDTLIGLKRGGASISLEPGGQFELSGATLDSIHETCAEIDGHLEETRAVAEPMGAAFLAFGFAPTWSLADTPVMPKGRYGIMTRYMQRVGRLGREMMFRSCTVQTNLDFGSEADMVKKMRVSLALQPVATALFANSPFAEGRPNGYLSYRANVWGDTDPDRTGMLPFAFDEGFGFEAYVDYALDVPMYFARRGGRYIDCAGLSFRDFMEGKLETLPGELPTMDDFDDHLSTIFPEVRLKTFLEMRGADSGPHDRLCALSAFWVGLLYDEDALDAAWRLVRDWTAPEREMLRRTVPLLGLATPLRGTNLHAVARQALEISSAGLRNRARLNKHGRDETSFLDPLQEIVESGLTPAHRLLEKWRGPWRRDLSRAFAEYRY